MSERGLSQSVEATGTGKFSPEWLASRSTLEVETRLDAAPVLEALNKKLGTNMQQRPEGFHITVIGPTEYGSIKDFSASDLERLKEVSAQIQRGEGIVVSGVGYIDGATAPGIRDADKNKKTSFIALDIPALNELREKHGLSKKDFHVTLGFEGGDIHMQVVGTEPGPKGKTKDILAPIEKKSDPVFEGLLDSVELSFGGINGQEKQKAVEKQKAEKAPEVPKEYSEKELTENLRIYEAEGKIPAGSVEVIKAMIMSGNTKELGKNYGKQMASIRAAMIASEKK